MCEIASVFNVSQLRPYYDPSARFLGRFLEPQPPLVVDGELEYEVEQVLGHKTHRGRHEYLINWRGYSDQHL